MKAGFLITPGYARLDRVEDTLAQLPADVTVLTGAAIGYDRWLGSLSRAMGFQHQLVIGTYASVVAQADDVYAFIGSAELDTALDAARSSGKLRVLYDVQGKQEGEDEDDGDF